MFENEKISVVIPVYKVEKYLKKCIDSVRNQTYENLEIILVDDGSPDNCGKMCDDLAKEDTRIKVIHKTNGGLSDARNAGIDMAEGDYLAFVDSDDWIENTMYEEMLNEKISFLNFQNVYYKILITFERGNKKWKLTKKKDKNLWSTQEKE